MSKKLRTKIGIAVSGVAFLAPFFTHAANFIEGFALSGVGMIVGFISYIIGALGGFAINLGGYLINLGIQLNSNLVNDSLVQLGFNITLDVVNLMFVLIIIIMAFSTVLGAGDYGVKKTLPKLIAAALLVNFGLVFAGLIIDFTGVFTKYFIAQATGNGAFTLADALTTALAPQSLLNPSIYGGFAAATDFDVGMVKIVLTGLFTSIFTVIEAIVVLGTAAMIFIRYIRIVLQLIIMPFVWLLWLVPEYSGKFKGWWDDFLAWTLFMPIASFFIYLAIALIAHTDVISGQSAISTSVLTAASTPTDPGVALLGTQDLFQTVGKMIAVIGMLTGGLMISQKMGIEGASMAIGYANRVRGWTLGQAGKVGGRALRATGRVAGAPFAAAGGGIANKLLQKGGRAEWAAGILKGVAGSENRMIRGLGRLTGAGSAAAGLYNLTATRRQSVEEQIKAMAGDSKDATMARIMGGTTNKVEQAALINKAIKDGSLEQLEKTPIGKERLEQYASAAKAMGYTKDIEESSPQLAPLITSFEEIKKKDGAANEENWKDKAIEIAMAKFKPGKTDTLSDTTIRLIGHNFRKEHAERLAKEGDEKQLLALAEVATKLKVASLEGKNTDYLQHPVYKFVMQNMAMQRVVLSPKYEEKMKQIKEDVVATLKAKEERMKKKPGKQGNQNSEQERPRLYTPPGSDISAKKEGPPVGFNS